jgi:hypothetical protein
MKMKFSTVIIENGNLTKTTAEDFSFKSKKERDFFVSTAKCLMAEPWEIKRGQKGNKKTEYHATIHQPRNDL